MRVLVLGAGVVGTSTAWYLSKAGHDVTVIDRRDSAGLETSYANGGQVSPCHAEPWANPAILPKVLKWLGREDAPLLFRWNRWDPDLWRWGLQFLANCLPNRAAVNTERTLRVALYSRTCLQDLRNETGIEYDQRRLGILHIYRNRREFEHARATADLMGRWGLRRLDKTPQECVDIEPALAQVAPQLAGGIHTPDDESGDAYKFTCALADLAAARGVIFRFGVTARALVSKGDRIAAIDTDHGTLTADVFVLAAGSYSPLLAHSLGLALPIIPAKGYSITLPAESPGAPAVSITDDEFKLVYSRLGDRLRVAGTAEMTGYDTSLTPARWHIIRDRAKALFPKAGDYSQSAPWTGLRPVTPDSVPLLGPVPKIRNLFLNTGHGTLGWTMACGSGRVIADMISERQPDIPTEGLGLERF